MRARARVYVCVRVCVRPLLHSEDSETCRPNIPVSSFQPTTNRGFVKHWGRFHLLGRHGIVSGRVVVPVVCTAETHAAVTSHSTPLFSSLSFLHRLFVLYRPLLIRFILLLFSSFFFTFPLPLSSYFVTNLYSSLFCCTFKLYLLVLSIFPLPLFCTN